MIQKMYIIAYLHFTQENLAIFIYFYMHIFTWPLRVGQGPRRRFCGDLSDEWAYHHRLRRRRHALGEHALLPDDAGQFRRFAPGLRRG